MKWLPTYFLTLALAAFGTATQGDDSPWFLSLFVYAPVAAIAIGWNLFRPGGSRSGLWLAAGHAFTVYLAVTILPDYWIRVTLAGDHLASGISEDYIGAFTPAWWHTFWAPAMTVLVVALVGAIGRLIFVSRGQSPGSIRLGITPDPSNEPS